MKTRLFGWHLERDHLTGEINHAQIWIGRLYLDIENGHRRAGLRVPMQDQWKLPLTTHVVEAGIYDPAELRFVNRHILVRAWQPTKVRRHEAYRIVGHFDGHHITDHGDIYPLAVPVDPADMPCARPGRVIALGFRLGGFNAEALA
ncbi:hypothetical protein ABIA24_001768 [Sinorhizobium fredii]|uniref:hypothetical protein n=1 Tax=Rhizobium fredii TaxID=380 RepID=UPI003097FFBB